MDIIEEFKELVMIDSASGQERAIADVLTAKLRALGFAVTEDRAGDTFGGNTGNLTAVREGDRPGAILFCSHMDRVANGLHIRPREKDGCLVSDGTTILVRPSGTEPKLKTYISVSAENKEAAEKVEAEICKNAEEYLK